MKDLNQHFINILFAELTLNVSYNGQLQDQIRGLQNDIKGTNLLTIQNNSQCSLA